MSEVEFTNNSMQIKKALREKAIAFLEEAAGEVQTAVHNASRVDTERQEVHTLMLSMSLHWKQQLVLRKKMLSGKSSVPANMLCMVMAVKVDGIIRMKKGMDTSHMVRHQTDRLRRLSRQRRVQFSTGQMRYSES